MNRLVLLYSMTMLFFFALSSCKDDNPSSRARKKGEAKEALVRDLVFVGTYTKKEPHVDGKAEGIYVYKMDLKTGALSFVSVVKGAINPSYLAVSPNRKFLFAVNEINSDTHPNGFISSYNIDRETGELTLLSRLPSEGSAPCYVSVDQTGSRVLIANYFQGTVAMYPYGADGRLTAVSDVKKQEGSGPHSDQDASHPHSIVLSPDNRFAFVPDKGTDKIMIYQVDMDNGKLNPAAQAFVSVQAGAGPRHFTFHPNGNFAYLINELDGTINGFNYESTSGRLEQFQSVNTLPEAYEGLIACADIHISPDGKFLYGSNRGHDSIVIFSINKNNGKLTLVGHEPTQGAFPRNFMIDPSGAFLLVANQNSDNIVVFRIDKQSGKLEPTGHIAEVPTPVCLKM